MNNNLLFQSMYHKDSLSNDLVNEYERNKDEFYEKGFVLSAIKIEDDLPETPIYTGNIEVCNIKTTLNNLFAFLKVMELYPVVYEGENSGSLIRHVVPRVGREKEVSSHGSHADFLPHVDNPDLRLRGEVFDFTQSPCPDTLTLLCLRNQEGVATSLLALDDVLACLNHNDISLLLEPVYNVKRPASFENSSTLLGVPVLYWSVEENLILTRFDYHNIFSDSIIHNTALDKFKMLCLQKKLWRQYYLKPGEAITFDNQRFLHTRNGFKSALDGKDRWLIRVFSLYNEPEHMYFLSSDCNHHLLIN